MPPIHRITNAANRDRRSTWAGVSWPNEDRNEEDELDVFRQSFVALRARRLTRQATMRFARSYEFWRDRRRAKRSSPSFDAAPRLSIEVNP